MTNITTPIPSEPSSNPHFPKWASRRRNRIIVGIAVPLLLLTGMAVLYFFGNPFICLFHEVTGLYCPGCGTGRALTSILHLDFLSAIHYNILTVIFLPFLAYFLVKSYISFVFKRGTLKVFPMIPIKLFTGITIFIIAFWILRNIPVSPFTLIAPGS